MLGVAVRQHAQHEYMQTQDIPGDAEAAAASKGSKAERKGGWRGDKVVSSTAVTPGTPFMHDVCVSCSNYICARLLQQRWRRVRYATQYAYRVAGDEHS